MTYVECRHRSRPRTSAGAIERMFERVPLLPLDPQAGADAQLALDQPQVGLVGPRVQGDQAGAVSPCPWWKGQGRKQVEGSGGSGGSEG